MTWTREQANAYQREWRKRRMQDPEYRAHVRGQERERSRTRYNDGRYREKHKETMARQRERIRQDPVRLEKQREYWRRKSRLRRASAKDFALRRDYGMTLTQFHEMVAAQNHRCAICARALEGIMGSVDHDHETGVVRAILCRRCNLGLGQFEDDPERLAAAARCLFSHKGERDGQVPART